MSVDYNEKFKELRKKISLIYEQNSDISGNKNFYKNRIKQLELNSEQKLNSISNKVNSLKNDFIKINSLYFTESQKNYNKNNSFYYPIHEKQEIDEKKLFIKNFSTQITEEISNNSKEIQNNINLKFFEIENKLKRMIEKRREDKKIIKKEITALAGGFRDNIENLNQNVDNKRFQEENILININQNFKKEINNTYLELKEMQAKNEKNDNMFSNKLKEMNDWIKNNFKKEKRKREIFQEKVMKILKETCQKLSDDFYKNNNDNNDESENEEENEINEEEDNLKIYKNSLIKYNNNIEINNIEKDDFIYNNINNQNKDKILNMEINQSLNKEKNEERNIYIENNNNNEMNNNNIYINDGNDEMLKEQNEQNNEEYIEGEENYEEGNYEEYEECINDENNDCNEEYNEEEYYEEEAVEENIDNNLEENNDEENNNEENNNEDNNIEENNNEEENNEEKFKEEDKINE